LGLQHRQRHQHPEGGHKRHQRQHHRNSLYRHQQIPQEEQFAFLDTYPLGVGPYHYWARLQHSVRHLRHQLQEVVLPGLVPRMATRFGRDDPSAYSSFAASIAASWS
jgi:hypothetical protein